MAKATLTREFYIKPNSRKVAHRHSSAVAYVYDDPKIGPCAMVFGGKRSKPDWHLRFRSEQERFDRITRHFEAVQEREAVRIQRRKDRQAQGRGLEVGDVLSASWGYDQTNVDYFEVTGLVGKTMVEVREIGCERVETEWMQGKSVPAPGKFISEPMRRKANAGGVKIDRCRWASKMEPTAFVGGKPVFEATHWTAYH